MPEQTLPVLITGGCGFVGLNLLGYLMNKGFTRIRILDNLSVGSRENLENYARERGFLSILDERADFVDYELEHKESGNIVKVSLLIEDIRNGERMMEVVREGEAIAHLAAQIDVIDSVNDPYFDFQQNTLGTFNMLTAAVNRHCPAFVFASSAAAAGDQPPPNREDMAPKPLSPYGASKLAGEAYCSAFSGSFQLPTCSLRFANVYGLYSTFKTSVIAKFFRQALQGETLVIFGDGTQTRDFIHTHDLSHAIHRAIMVLASGNGAQASGEVFQIATGVETSVNELFALIKKLIERDKGGSVKFDYAPPRTGEIYRNYADIGKARQILDFRPEMNVDQGLEETWAWFQQQF